MGTGGCRFCGCTRLRLADCLSDLSNFMDVMVFMVVMAFMNVMALTDLTDLYIE
jgi:hypothetical protein